MANARLKLARVNNRKRRRNDVGSEEHSSTEVPVPLSRSSSQNCDQQEPETAAIEDPDDVVTALFDRKQALETRLIELSLDKPLPRLEEKGFDANGVRLKRLHRDFLLQEMEWMAADFAQERKWRMKTARTLSVAVVSHQAKKASRSARQEKLEEEARRRTAARVGREVKKFWTKIDKIISFKVKLQSDELRKAAMDRHLKSLMSQTERYASALALAFCESETKDVGGEDAPETEEISTTLDQDGDRRSDSDSDFQAGDQDEEEQDDETTIAAEEMDSSTGQSQAAQYRDEIATLREESELSVDELRAKYAVLAAAEQEDEQEDGDQHSGQQDEMMESCGESDDSDFAMDDVGGDDEEQDDETTIELQERTESRGDVEDEVAKLQEESELSIEELRARYAEALVATSTSPFDVQTEAIAEENREEEEEEEEEEEDYRPSEMEETDDETTLEIAEKTEFTKDEVDEEVRLLHDESELSIEELRAKYAAMEAADSMQEDPLDSPPDSEGGRNEEDDADSDFEHTGTDEEEQDDETTIAEAECGEKRTKEDVDDELHGLEDDNNLTIEELRARYYGQEENGHDASSSVADQEDENEHKGDDDVEATAVELDDKEQRVDTTDKEQDELHHVHDHDSQHDGDDADHVVETDSSALSTYKRPFLLTSRLELREYQQAGVNWLVSMCEKRINGILADEMGLGKTIQTITMLAHLACSRSVWGPHLIVVPTSCLVNWEMEFKRWCPAFKVLTYFGSAKRRKELRHGWSKLNAFHVCITSYQLVVQDAHCFKRKKWYYLILDEAHNIKNWKSLRWQTLLHFNSQRRLLLTGTPLQNNIMELWALMHFLMPHVFASRKEFTYWFQNPLSVMVEESSSKAIAPAAAAATAGGSSGQNNGQLQDTKAAAEPSEPQHQQLVAQLHGIIRPFVLRRLKKDVAKQLPGKFEHVVTCSLSKRQRFLYEDFISRSSTKRALFGGGSGSNKSSHGSGNFMSMMNVLMQLRKVCNHPDLFEPRPIASPLDMEPLTLQLPMRCAYIYDWLERRTESIAYWPAALCLPNQELHGYDRFTNARAKKLLHFYDDVNLVDDQLPAECAVDTTTIIRRPDVARRLLLLAQARRAYWIAKRQHYERVARITTSLHEPMLGADVVRACTMPVFISHAMDVHAKRASQDSRDSLTLSEALSAMVRDPLARIEELQPIVRKAVCAVPKARARPLAIQFVGRGFSADTTRTGNDPAKLSRKVRMDRYVDEQLTCVASRCLDPFYESFKRTQLFFPDKRLIQFDCGKLQQLDLLLRELKRGKHRCLIFTQMSSMLNILEIFLNLHGHTYFRLDGSTKVEQRQYLMEKFNHDDKIFCFILSTRSGGLGINLTGADSVIFYDSDWNPAMDAQAQDRAHRIGQTRDVHIYRLVSEHTVEENILKKAQQKRHLDFLVMAKGGFTTEFFSKASLRELMGDEMDKTTEKEQDNVEEDGAHVGSRIEELHDEEDEVEEEEEDLSLDAIESAMAQLEDEDDVVAMRGARDEFLSEQREFDEETNATTSANGASDNNRRRVSNAGTDVSRVSTPTADGQDEEDTRSVEEDGGVGEEEEEDTKRSSATRGDVASVLTAGDGEATQGQKKNRSSAVANGERATVMMDDSDAVEVASVEQDTSVLEEEDGDEDEDDGDYTGQGSDAEREAEDESGSGSDVAMSDDDDDMSDDDGDDEDDGGRRRATRPAKRKPTKSAAKQKNASGHKRRRSDNDAQAATASKRAKRDQLAVTAAQELKKQERAKERAREVEEERKLQAWKDSVSSLQHFEDSLNPVDRYALHFREEIDPLFAYVPTAEAFAQLEKDDESNMLLVNIEEIEARKMVEEQQWIADGELIAGVTTLDELTQEEMEMHLQLYKKERSAVHAFHRQRQLTGEAWETRKCAITGQLFYFNSDTREATWDKPIVWTKNEQLETARAGGFAGLPLNVLLLVFAKLRSFPDRLQGVEFVCQSWRDAARHPSLCMRVNASDFYQFQTSSIDNNSINGDRRGRWSELLKSVDRGETLLFGSGVYEIHDVVEIDKPIRLLAAQDAHVELQMTNPLAQLRWTARGGVLCGFHVSRRHGQSPGSSSVLGDHAQLQRLESPSANNWQHLLHVMRGGRVRAVFNDFDGNYQGNACVAVSGDPQSLLVLQHNRIFHSGSGSGVLLLQGALVMQRNSVFQNAHSGVTVWSGNAVLRRNQILNNRRFGIRLLYHANNVVIEENKVEGHACGNIDTENSGRRFVVRWNEMLKDDVDDLPHTHHGSVRLRTSRVEERVIPVAASANPAVAVVKRMPKQPKATLSQATAASLPPVLVKVSNGTGPPILVPASVAAALGILHNSAAIVSTTTTTTIGTAGVPSSVGITSMAGPPGKLAARPVVAATAPPSTTTTMTPRPTGSVAATHSGQIHTRDQATVSVTLKTESTGPVPVQVATPASLASSSSATVMSVPVALGSSTPLAGAPSTVSAVTTSAITPPATTTVAGAPAAATTVPTEPLAVPVKAKRKRKPKTEKVLVHGVEIVFRDTCEKKGFKKVKKPRRNTSATSESHTTPTATPPANKTTATATATVAATVATVAVVVAESSVKTETNVPDVAAPLSEARPTLALLDHGHGTTPVAVAAVAASGSSHPDGR